MDRQPFGHGGGLPIGQGSVAHHGMGGRPGRSGSDRGVGTGNGSGHGGLDPPRYPAKSTDPRRVRPGFLQASETPLSARHDRRGGCLRAQPLPEAGAAAEGCSGRLEPAASDKTGTSAFGPRRGSLRSDAPRRGVRAVHLRPRLACPARRRTFRSIRLPRPGVTTGLAELPPRACLDLPLASSRGRKGSPAPPCHHAQAQERDR